MIERFILTKCKRFLTQFPAVALLGPRQVGKTTLAKTITQSLGGAYFDLERPSDRLRLSDPERTLGLLQDQLVVLDEIQRIPELFSILRPLIDDQRRPGRFLLLGSASIALLSQASETLAGRIGFIEMSPFTLSELRAEKAVFEDDYLLRGGFPQSWLATSDQASFEWRSAFIQTFLERDIPQFGFRMPAAALERFWTMVAHWHGQLWNASRIAASMGVSAPTVDRYLDALEGAYMLRRLYPMQANVMKRLVKSPKIYLRDTGILNALLGLEQASQMNAHPAIGAMWESMVIEQFLANLPSGVKASFYRTARGAEVDLVLQKGNLCIPIECKFSSAPKPSRGFHEAFADLQAKQGFVIAPVSEEMVLPNDIVALPLSKIDRVLSLVG